MSRLLLVFALLLNVFFVVRQSFRKCECETTYMFADYESVLNQKRYRLYQYIERHQPSDRPYPRGGYLPVLFLPGSGGTYKQVAPLASETTRIFNRAKGTFEFKLRWFAVDLGGEISAFNSEILESQSSFVKTCVKKIQSLELNPGPIPRLMIVGHSIGGVLASTLASDLVSSVGPNFVHLLVTFASPHSRPILLLHPSMSEFYSRTQKRSSIPSVHIYGGERDTQVTQSFVPMHSKDGEIIVKTDSIAGVWTSVQHQRVIVCNQLIQRMAQFLLHCTNFKTNSELLHAHENLTNLVDEYLIRPSLSNLKEATPDAVCKNRAMFDLSTTIQVQSPMMIKLSDLESMESVCFEWRVEHEVWIVLHGVTPCEGFQFWTTGTCNLTQKTDLIEVTLDAIPLSYSHPNLRPKPVPRNMSRIVRNGRNYFNTASWLIHLNQKQTIRNPRIIGCFNETRRTHNSMVIFEDSQKDAIESFELSFRNLFWPKILGRRLMDINQEQGISGMRIRVQIPTWTVHFRIRVRFSCESGFPLGDKDCVLPAKIHSKIDQSEWTFIRHPELEYQVKLEFDFLAWLWDLTILTAGKSVGLTVYFLSVLSLDGIQARKLTERKLFLQQEKSRLALGSPLLVSCIMDGIGAVIGMDLSKRSRDEYQFVWYLRLFHRIFAMFISKGIAQLAFLLLTHIWIKHRRWIQGTYSKTIDRLKKLDYLKRVSKRWTGIMWNLLVYVLLPCWLHPALICALSLDWSLKRALEGDYFSAKMVPLHLSGILIQLPSFYSWISLPIQYKHLSLVDVVTSWMSLANHLSFQTPLPFELPDRIWILVYQSMRHLAAGWILTGGSDFCVWVYTNLCIWSLMMVNGIIHQRQVEKSQ